MQCNVFLCNAMYVCMHFCLFACMFACLSVCMYACMCIYLYVYMYVFPEGPSMQIAGFFCPQNPNFEWFWDLETYY